MIRWHTSISRRSADPPPRRGYAPLPIRLRRELPTILAVGGHLKNTVALSLGSAGGHDAAHRRLGHGAERRGASPGDRRPGAVLRRDAASGGLRSAPRLRVDAARRAVGRRLGRAAGARPASPRPRRGLRRGAWPGRAGPGPVLGRHGLRDGRTVWGGEVLLCDGDRVCPRRPPADVSPARRRSSGPRAATFGVGRAVRNPRPRGRRRGSPVVHGRGIAYADRPPAGGRSCSRGPAAWAGCSTPWPRCADCRLA